MFAGHLGAALALGRMERRVNVGWLVLAALWLDAVLWCLVLLGWETVTIPADFASSHQPAFVFPYSHGLLASLGWSVLAGAVAWWILRRGSARWPAAAVVATGVFSHWLLDALVHAPELPLAGADSAKLGLALWNAMPLALALEALIALAGCWLFLVGSGLPRGRKIGLALLSAVVLVSTVFGMTAAPPPPSALAMAATSLVTILAVCGLVAWLGRR